MLKLKYIIISIGLLIFLNVSAQELTVSVLSKPIPVPTSKGTTLLIYELHIVNKGFKPWQLNRIEVFDPRNKNKPLVSYSGSSLSQNVIHHTKTLKRVTQENPFMKKGMGAIAYIWIEFPTGRTPTRLRNKIWLTSVTKNETFAQLSTMNYSVDVSTTKPLRIGPPLQGVRWVAEAAPSPYSYHRRASLPVDGKFYLAQRYAVDWVQINKAGREAEGNMHDNKNWLAFGSSVLAVADGIVTKIADNIPENTPPGLPNPSPPLDKADGNYILLKVKQDNVDYYVLYAHLQPNSIKVKVGDHVKRGDVLAKLGNTGNSSAPHLHLHVTSTNEPLKAEGVPFVFDRALISGTAGPLSMDFGIWLWPNQTTTRPKTYQRVIPLDNQTFKFDE